MFSPKIIEFETENVQVFSSSSHPKTKSCKKKKAALDNHCAAFFFLYKISHNYDFLKKIATNSMSFF